MTTITSKNQPKPLTERQIWAYWNHEYNRSKRSGFSNDESINRADALVREKRQERDALITEAGAAREQLIETDIATYWCQSIGRWVTVPEDEA